MVAVVQLVEHLVVVQDVAGSSPVSHPDKKVHGTDRLGVVNLFHDCATSAGDIVSVGGQCGKDRSPFFIVICVIPFSNELFQIMPKCVLVTQVVRA